VSAAVAWVLRRLAALARGHARRCGCPACDKTERDARRLIGMPIRHPERITRDLPAGQDEWLAALADQLWPDDEYTAIITELRRKDQP
jgi:hypothetical protein